MKANKLIIGMFLIGLVAFGGCLQKTNNKNNGAASLANGINDMNKIKPDENTKEPQKTTNNLLQEKVAPNKGIVLPVKWNDVLVKAVAAGAIDLNRYRESLRLNGAKLIPEHEKLLTEGSDENISFTPESAYFNLNMLWALGLVNENPILTKGKISEYGDKKSYFASTGGWTLGNKKGGELLASAKIITLTPEQQKIVDDVTATTYRPCCSNPTGFPDCNHGMAALALAELMASQGATEQQIYDALLVANSYWFTQTYVGIAQYLKENGKDFSTTNSKELLSYDYSSQNGYSKIRNSIKSIPKINTGGSTCAI